MAPGLPVRAAADARLGGRAVHLLPAQGLAALAARHACRQREVGAVGLEINTFETASALAARLGAQCSYLAAPLYAGSARSRDTIVAQDVFQEAFRQMAANDLALLSVGDLSTRSLLVRYGLPKDVSVASLRKARAVGDITGQFLDRHGKPVRHALNQRVVAPFVTELARIPTVVVASGGENKAPIIAAVLFAKLLSVLICDEKTARTALRLHESLGER